MDRSEIRSDFLQDIELAMEFRQRKAEEYPDDERNQRSAEALKSLHAHVEALDADDDLFKVWESALTGDEEAPMKVNSEVFEKDGGTGKLERYGFDIDQPPAEFCDDLRIQLGLIPLNAGLNRAINRSRPQ